MYFETYIYYTFQFNILYNYVTYKFNYKFIIKYIYNNNSLKNIIHLNNTCAFLKNNQFNRYNKYNKYNKFYRKNNKYLRHNVLLPRNSLKKIKMINPNEIVELTKSSNNNYDIWSYLNFVNNVKNIDSAAIIDNKNLILLSEKLKQHNSDTYIDINNIHLLKYIVCTIDTIVNTLTNKGINYQVFDIPTSEPIQAFQYLYNLLFLYYY